MTNDKVIDKIRSILRKADESKNDSEGERQVAMEMENRLLLKHGLSMQDVGELNVDETGRAFEDTGLFEISDSPDDTWKGVMLNSIAKVYFCKCYMSRTANGHRMFLVGRGDYVAMCRTMYEFVAPQIEREYQAALLNITQSSSPNLQQQARLAREYAIAACIEDGIRASDLTEDELAEAGKTRFNAIKSDAGAEMAILDVMALAQINSLNYAKKVRAFITRGHIAGAMPENMAVWRRSFYDAAVMRIAARLREMMTEQLHDEGQAGMALVKNEAADLARFLDQIGLRVGAGKRSQRKVDYEGRRSGDDAGRRADLSGHSKVRGPGGRRQLNA